MPSSPYTDAHTRAAAAANAKQPETEPELIASVSDEVRKQRSDTSLKAKTQLQDEEVKALKEVANQSPSTSAEGEETCESMLAEVLGQPTDFNKPIDSKTTSNDLKKTTKETKTDSLDDKQSTKEMEIKNDTKPNLKKKDDSKATLKKKETPKTDPKKKEASKPNPKKKEDSKPDPKKKDKNNQKKT